MRVAEAARNSGIQVSLEPRAQEAARMVVVHPVFLGELIAKARAGRAAPRYRRLAIGAGQVPKAADAAALGVWMTAATTESVLTRPRTAQKFFDTPAVTGASATVGSSTEVHSTSRSLRILIIASEGPPTRSGIARTVQQLQRGLRARGHQVDVVSYPLVSRVVLNEIRLYGLAFHLWKLVGSLDQYDVIHVHGAVPTFSDAFLLAARANRDHPPVVYTHHCDVGLSRGTFLANFYNRIHRGLASISADHEIFTTSGYAARAGVSDGAAVIPLGVTVGQCSDTLPKDPDFTILFVGQFRPYKGVRVLLNALSRVDGAKLIVAGSGFEEKAYRRLAAHLNVDTEFHIGVQDEEMKALYQRSHVIVLPSVTPAEAFGLVLLEGMAAGCVPVASDLVGVRDVLGRIGFAVPPGSVEALSGILRYLRDNRVLVERIGQRARLRARAFTWERTIIDYERLFRDLAFARDLRCRSAQQPVAQSVAAHIRASLDADRADALVVSTLGGHVSVASSTRSTLAPIGKAVSSADIVGKYVLETGERVLLSRSDGPPRVARKLAADAVPTIAVPLQARGLPIGALVASRDAAFHQRDLDCLARLAQHVGPILVAPSSNRWAKSRLRADDGCV